MDEKSKKKVYDAIRKHGDSFWNDKAMTQDDGNWLLFEDILSYLNKEGLDLELVLKNGK